MMNNNAVGGAGRDARPAQLGSAEEERFVAAGTNLLSPALARVFGLEDAVAYGEPTTGNSSGDASASASGAARRGQLQHAQPGLPVNALAGPKPTPGPASATPAEPSDTGARAAADQSAPSSATAARGASGAAGYAKRVRGVADEAPAPAAAAAADEGAPGGAKRPRLVWSPALHSRFVDAVTHLGIKAAVPKTIMQLMNVEGLTRENVASHLQKFRLYTRRLNDAAGGRRSGGSDDDGLEDDGPGASGAAS